MVFTELELKVKEQVQKGEIEIACQLIFDLIVAYAKNKDIANATSWRNKLIQLDPTQLARIYDSGQIIESKKTPVIDSTHKSLWKSLYSSLTDEEGDLLYQKLQQREFPSGKTLIQQGKLNNALFFLEKGQLQTFYRQGSREVFFNNLDIGDTAGQDTFFNASVCTNSVITSNTTNLRYLSRSALQEVEKSKPGFTDKLANIFSWLESKKPNANKNKNIPERRQHERFEVSQKITAQTFDNKKQPIRPMYSGWLTDISNGGAAFIINYSDKEIGRSLLGRVTNLSIKFSDGSKNQLTGQILGARFDKVAYIVNLKFAQPIAPSLVKEFIDDSSKSPQTTSY
ncbi:MAG: cyclic nucleotide-binding domain-containing protein [Nitrospinales bacterium]